MHSAIFKGNRRKGKRAGRRWSLRGASLTVECAAVLPIFFMACLTLISFMDAMRIQAEENLKLSNQARTLAVGTNVITSAAGDVDGIWIDRFKVYKMEYPFPDFGLADLKIALRARVYPWVGSDNGIFDGEGKNDGRSGKNDTIYLTDNREVYHTHSDCTHLSLSIIKTDMNSVKSMRNASGRKYKRCPNFPKNYSGPVYVTENGDYYYPSTDYGSLTRHVQAARREEAGSLKLCERCAARDKR